MADNNGAERLVNSIVSDARSAAAATAAEAEKKVAKIKKEAEKEASALREEYLEKAEIARNSIIDRERTNAELEARMLLLAKKRGLLDKAYDEAYSRLASLKGEKRASLIKRNLLNEADGGETVVPSKNDRALIESIINEVNKTLTSRGRSAVTLSNDLCDKETGFVLYGNGFIKDCSFSALLASVRSESESETAKILFG